MENFYINRRRFLQTASASLALTALGASGLGLIYPNKPLRVGLIEPDGMAKVIYSG